MPGLLDFLSDNNPFGYSPGRSDANALVRAKAAQQLAAFRSQQAAMAEIGLGPDPTTGKTLPPTSMPTASSVNLRNQIFGGAQPQDPTPQNLLGIQNDYKTRQFSLLDQADPETALKLRQSRAAMEPLLSTIPEQDRPLAMMDTKGYVDARTKNAYPEPTPLEKQLRSRGYRPGDKEWNDAIDAQREHDTFIPEHDPNKIAQMQAATASDRASAVEKGASTKLSEARAKALADNAITDDAVEFRAQLALAGDTDSAFKGLPGGMLGSAARAKVTDRWAALAHDNNVGGDEMNKIRMQQKAANAALGQVAKRAGSADYNANEMSILGGQLEEASKAVDRVGWTDLNDITNFAKSHSSNPEYGALDVAVQGFKTGFTQALSRNGVPTDQGRAKADKLFSGARNHADLMARVAQAQKEAGGVIEAGDRTKQQILDGVSSGRQQPAPAGASWPNPGDAGIPKWNRATQKFE